MLMTLTEMEIIANLYVGLLYGQIGAGLNLTTTERRRVRCMERYYIFHNMETLLWKPT